MFSKKFAAAVIITALAFTPAWAAGEVAGAASKDVSNEAAADIAAHETVPAQTAPPAERSKDQTVQPQEKPAFEMPEVYREALSFVKQNRAELQGELEKLLSEGKGKEAARKLGAAFSREHGGSAAYLAFFWRMLRSGVFLTPSQFETDFISAAHSPDVIDTTLEAFSSCLKS